MAKNSPITERAPGITIEGCRSCGSSKLSSFLNLGTTPLADQLMTDLGFAPIYDCRCPFSFMQTLGLEGKTNFFESRASEYARAGISHVATDPDASGTSDEDDF